MRDDEKRRRQPLVRERRDRPVEAIPAYNIGTFVCVAVQRDDRISHQFQADRAYHRRKGFGLAPLAAVARLLGLLPFPCDNHRSALLRRRFSFRLNPPPLVHLTGYSWLLCCSGVLNPSRQKHKNPSMEHCQLHQERISHPPSLVPISCLHRSYAALHILTPESLCRALRVDSAV